MPDQPNLLPALAAATRAHPYDRKLLVCETPAQGRELLRALAAGGTPWIGWEVTALWQLAGELVAPQLAAAGSTVADTFDELALTDEAIDAASTRGAAGPFGGSAGAGYREAIRRALEQLRGAGVTPAALHRARRDDDAKLAALAEILAEYERLLAAARRVDTAAVLAAAADLLESGAAALPQARVYLLPGLRCGGLAARLLAALQAHGAEVLATDAVVGLPAPPELLWRADEEATGPLGALHAAAPSGAPPALALFAAATPTDELREVLRRVVAAGIPWDQVEIVTPDPHAYGAALDALARRLAVPVTYAAGLDSRRTRVGRALDGYLRWIADGFPADLLRALLESGDIATPELPRTDGSSHPPRPFMGEGGRGGEGLLGPAPVIAGDGGRGGEGLIGPAPDISGDGCGGAEGPALARRLRRLRVGWGQARYLERIDHALEALAAAPIAATDEQDEEDARAARDREIRELGALRSLLAGILAATPRHPGRAAEPPRTSPAAVARGALVFLERVPAGDGVESAARASLHTRLTRAADTLTRETAWDAAIGVLRGHLDTRVAPAAEGAPASWTSAPGRLHLSDLVTGGLARRPHTFVVGLDAGRTAGSGAADPLLTDADRGLLRVAGFGLPLSADRVAESRFRLAATLARLRGSVTLSYSAWDATEGRAVSPAPELLQAYRLREGDPSLGYKQLREALGGLACAVPAGAAALDDTDVWMAALAGGGVPREGVAAVRAGFPGLDRGLHAAAQRAGDEATHFHGCIEPRPELDPRLQRDTVFSATRLEALGACPRRFFYRYVLGVSPTQDPEWDTESWLDALERGSLLHAVYEHTLRDARAAGEDYADAAFAARALATLAREVRRTLGHLPPPSQAVLDAESRALEDDVRIWVATVRESRPEWVELERKFGPDVEEVELLVAGGSVRVRGAIDRVDRVADGVVRIVDYKTGGSGWYRARAPFKGGRRIQHLLYTRAAEQLLGARVERMEYHFPTRKGENRVVPYAAAALARGDEVLTALVETAAAGRFLATDHRDDCTYCDFAAVCRAQVDDFGNARSPAAEWTKARLADHPELERLRLLRSIDA